MDNCTYIDLLLTAGQLLLEAGAETYRAEDAALYIFKQIGQGEINIFAVPTVLIIDIKTPEGESVSGVRRIRRRSIDLGKIERINTVVRHVSAGELAPDAALRALTEIDAKTGGSTGRTMFVTALAAGAFSLLLDGGLCEVGLAFLCCLVAQCASLFFSKVSMYQFFSSFLGGFVPTLILALATRLLPALSAETVLLASMLPLFPGVATVNAIRDAINGDLISGVSRAAEALMIAFGLGMGASVSILLGVA